MSLSIRLHNENEDLIRMLSIKYDVSCKKITNAMIATILKDIKMENIKVEMNGIKITLQQAKVKK